MADFVYGSQITAGTGFVHPRDLPVVLAFSAISYLVAEGGTATITVTRTGAGTGPASVDYATSNGTAAAGVDYTAAAGTLTWADGDTAPKTFAVVTLADASSESAESIGLALTNAVGGAIGRATSVLIVD